MARRTDGRLSPGTTISGEGVQALVEVMDRLRSPGGCPWDARQTHASLVPYALEEAYEVAEAIESGDSAAMREELGDLLLQVVFHARIAQDSPTDPFDLDDVAREITAKLVRRHPHVFDRAAPAVGAGGGSAAGVDLEDLHVQWDRIKGREKQRESVLDGIPAAQGALARGQKVLARARRAGIPAGGDLAQVALPLRSHGTDGAHGAGVEAWTEAEVGRRLLELVAAADLVGVDAESALRHAVRAVEIDVRAAEEVSRDQGPAIRPVDVVTMTPGEPTAAPRTERGSEDR
ncbi:MAG TPA: MazG family protein [Cellulomonas sp.]|uniref:MazG family protein n=1 Tax=Cellulomonas sp. TaxID=40001 RepID=UPI002E2F9BCB|nr:MazG family protein [Cellulomonas sp.]HEX5333704.1 MazG family protein [Cellulomonas sp.]